MGNSGFPTVREITSGTFVANQEFFTNNTLMIMTIQGDGNATNTVSVTVSDGDHDLEVGDTVTIFGVSTQTDYNLDIGVTVTAVISTADFQYETTNHTNSIEDTTGDFRVLNPYTFDDVTPNDLGVFVHLSVGLGGSSIIQSTRDGINYVSIGNGESLIGDIFKSIIMNQGDKVNFRVSTGVDVTFGKLYREP